jgi:hypothetical protein
MKKPLLLLIFVLFCQQAFSRKMDSLYVYMDAGALFGINKINGVTLGINAVYKQHAFTFSHCDFTNAAKNVPADYEPGFALFGGTPLTSLFLLGLEYGHVWYSSKPIMRFVLKGGLFMGTYEYPDNFVPQESTGMFFTSSNYSFEYKTEKVFAVKLSPTLELPSRFAGLSIGLFGLIVPKSSTAGLQINVLLGKVRNKLRH